MRTLKIENMQKIGKHTYFLGKTMQKYISAGEGKPMWLPIQIIQVLSRNTLVKGARTPEV